MKIIVCGGRDFDDRNRVYEALDRLHIFYGINEVIHGCARGADELAGEWARYRDVKEARVRADWEKEGRNAGPIRNLKMAQMEPDFVVAFPGGKGTANMVKTAGWYEIEVLQR